MEEVINNKNLIELMDIKDWLSLNAKLSQKKNKARQKLVEMGVLEKKGKNKYDNYKYFTEAQYKDVANKIFVEAGLELKTSEKSYEKFETKNPKTPVGRIVEMEYTLTDTETGFYEKTTLRGEGLDRGDKAGYKAYTGAIKYYLANTFLIPTGDDPETESPEIGSEMTKQLSKKEETEIMNLMQKMRELSDLTNTDYEELLKYYKVDSNAKMTLEQLRDCVSKLEMKQQKIDMLRKSGQEVTNE